VRSQTTFSVAAEGLDDAQNAEKKGTIEVTRVTDAHMSEARITSDEAINPLLPGDRLYSLVWDRGLQVGFAIAGIIDMNGDGREDLEKLKAVIAANNGRVDAAPPPYYYVADLYMESREEFEQLLASPEGQAAVADVPNYATGGVTFVYTEVEEII
jgi:hypothetical protein